MIITDKELEVVVKDLQQQILRVSADIGYVFERVKGIEKHLNIKPKEETEEKVKTK